MSGQQQVEHGVAEDMVRWCLRCAELRVRFHGAACLGRTAEAEALNAEFVRHQRLVHA
ncbi:hypothetical protein [Streptomyces sp. URMC 124]|uniref:hypothetical protein n=1 Tax=Streptomyces sp. URMC 124 TaxID=3423405 RepID=UPI003F194D98